MHICTVIKEKVKSLQIEQNKYVFKRDINDNSNMENLTSFGIVVKVTKQIYIIYIFVLSL